MIREMRMVELLARGGRNIGRGAPVEIVSGMLVDHDGRINTEFLARKLKIENVSLISWVQDLVKYALGKSFSTAKDFPSEVFRYRWEGLG